MQLSVCNYFTFIAIQGHCIIHIIRGRVSPQGSFWNSNRAVCFVRFDYYLGGWHRTDKRTWVIWRLSGKNPGDLQSLLMLPLPVLKWQPEGTQWGLTPFALPSDLSLKRQFCSLCLCLNPLVAQNVQKCLKRNLLFKWLDRVRTRYGKPGKLWNFKIFFPDLEKYGNSPICLEMYGILFWF